MDKELGEFSIRKYEIYPMINKNAEATTDDYDTDQHLRCIYDPTHNELIIASYDPELDESKLTFFDGDTLEPVKNPRKTTIGLTEDGSFKEMYLMDNTTILFQLQLIGQGKAKHFKLDTDAQTIVPLKLGE